MRWDQMNAGYTQDDLKRLNEKLDPLCIRMAEEGRAITRETKPLPRDLFHYTDSSALMGILENEELWATDTRFLNDISELQWAKHVFEKVIAEFQPNDDKEVWLLGKLAECMSYHQSGLSVYLSSFSENSDDLHQWRGYGTGNGPVCIAFRANHLQAKFSSYELLSVIYNEIEQEAIARRLIEMVLGFHREHCNDDNPANATFLIPICLMTFEKMAAYAVLRFKQPYWHSEREWRLVAVERQPDNLDHVFFRTGPKGIVPYIKMKGVDGVIRFNMMLDDVTVGPTADRTLSAKALEIYGRAKGFHFLRVSASKISLR